MKFSVGDRVRKVALHGVALHGVVTGTSRKGHKWVFVHWDKHGPPLYSERVNTQDLCYENGLDLMLGLL